MPATVPAGDLPGRLLAHLRAELRRSGLDYAEPLLAMPGGFDTRVYGFRLREAPPAWASRLVLRLLGPGHDPRRAERERIVQNAVADLGFPAPRVLTASADASTLGGAFLVMTRVPGRPLLEERWLGVAAVLARAQLRLHALDARPLLAAMAAAGEPEAITFAGLLAQLRARVERGALDGLRAPMDWLEARRPPEPARPVICHGDFHPQNILASGGEVTGVVDWPNAVVADPAYDVAATSIILGLVPMHLVSPVAAVRALLRLVLPVTLARYRRVYRRGRLLDARALAYYEAAACMRTLLRTDEQRRAAAAAGAALDPLDASAFGDRVAARFARLTGVAPRLARAGAPPRGA